MWKRWNGWRRRCRPWDGALLVVSHDRYFLDKVVNRIWEMSRGGMESTAATTRAYVQQRQERWERREAEFDAIREKFLRELDYVKRNIARDSTSAMAKGRLRRLIREVRVVQAGRLADPAGQAVGQGDGGGGHLRRQVGRDGCGAGDQGPAQPRPAARRQPEHASQDDAAQRQPGPAHQQLEIGYPGNSLFTADPIQLERQECAALIGPNGTGKTTFLRTLMGEMEPLDGEIRFGASLKVGYFAQAHDKLDPDKTVLDELLAP